MKNDGRLPWWDIAFEAEATPANLMICHRTDRRTLSGSAFRTPPYAFCAGSSATGLDETTGADDADKYRKCAARPV